MKNVVAEMQQNARPELSTVIDNLEEYDTIFIGYPIWNADLPTTLYTFIDEYDLSGNFIPSQMYSVDDTDGNNILVAYFSHSGNTQDVAMHIDFIDSFCENTSF